MKSIRQRLLAGLGLSGVLGATVLAIVVVLQYDLFGTPTGDAQTEIIEHVALPLILFLLLFGTGAVLVVRRVERDLENTAKEVSAAASRLESYDPNIQSFPTELQPFVTSVSELTHRLMTHARRQEAFAADAAHELKTPLALLTLELDKLSEKDAPRLRKHILSLSEMIDQLLLLARSNSIDIVSSGSLVDPAKLVRSIVEDMAPAAIAIRRELSCEVTEPKPIMGLDEAIGAAVRTLVSNALRATPSGGQVTLVAGPGPMITILDEGCGLPSDELERLKARGVRADSAAGGEAGLGLAIADRIAEAHGGELLTCLPEQNGLKLVFPSTAN